MYKCVLGSIERILVWWRRSPINDVATLVSANKNLSIYYICRPSMVYVSKVGEDGAVRVNSVKSGKNLRAKNGRGGVFDKFSGGGGKCKRNGGPWCVDACGNQVCLGNSGLFGDALDDDEEVGSWMVVEIAKEFGLCHFAEFSRTRMLAERRPRDYRM